MLYTIAIVITLLSVVMVLLGLYFLLSKNSGGKRPSASSSTTSNPAGANKVPDDGSPVEKISDEEHDWWYYFGFVDDTPNVMRAVVAGNEKTGGIRRYMGNLSGKYIHPVTGKLTVRENPNNYEFEDAHPIFRFIQTEFGRRWYGIPFIRNVRRVLIDRVVSKNTQATQKSLSDELLANTVVRYGVYDEMIRPTLHKDVDAEDNIRFSAISYSVLEATDAGKIFGKYSDNLLPAASKLISSYFSRKIIKEAYDDYKKGGNLFEQTEIDNINQLLDPLGVRVRQITMGDPELHPDIQKSQQQVAEAKQRANAKEIDGDGERRFKIKVADGDLYATKKEAEGKLYTAQKVAEGQKVEFETLVKYFKANGASNESAVRLAYDRIVVGLNAEAIGKLQTYVAGQYGIQLGIPAGERR